MRLRTLFPMALVAWVPTLTGCERQATIAERPLVAPSQVAEPTAQAEAPTAGSEDALKTPAPRHLKGYAVQVWSTETGRRRLNRFFPMEEKNGVRTPPPVVSSDGMRLATVAGDEVQIIALQDRTRSRRISQNGYRLVPERFVAGGSRLLVHAEPKSAGGTAALRLYALGGRVVAVLPEGDVMCSPDGRKAAVTVSDDSGVHVKVIDLHTGRQILRSHAAYSTWNDVKCFALSDRYLAALYHYAGGAPDNWVGVWDLNTRNSWNAGFGTGGYHRRIALSPDGKRLATLGEKGTLWDTGKQQLIGCFSVDALPFPPGPSLRSKLTVTAPSGKKMAVTDLSSRTAVAALQEQLLLAGGKLVQLLNGKVEVWDWVARRRTATITFPPEASPSITLSPDGQKVILLYESAVIRGLRGAAKPEHPADKAATRTDS